MKKNNFLRVTRQLVTPRDQYEYIQKEIYEHCDKFVAATSYEYSYNTLVV